MLVSPDDIVPGLAVTIHRRRRRRVEIQQDLNSTETVDEFYQVIEPGTITDVKRTKSGRVTEIEARNEATGRCHWYTARRLADGTGFSGYFRKGLEQSKPYQLILTPFVVAEG